MVHCPPFLYQRRVTMTLLTRHPEVPERSEGLEGRRPGAQISLCSLRKLDCGGRSSFEAPPALASLGPGRASATVFFFKRAATVFLSLSMALRMVTIFRATAMRATIFGLP